MTPPKRRTDPARLPEIAARQAERIARMQPDALVLYDLQDESSRTDEARPFPFLPTWSPDDYAHQYLGALSLPTVLYRAVANHDAAALDAWLDETRSPVVLVGAPSGRDAPLGLTLRQAYAVHGRRQRPTALGGVLIPERHAASGTEHERVLSKMAAGCSFFISQAIWSPATVERLLVDLQRACDERDRQAPLLVFTFCPCGNAKTLDFMGWLGIDMPEPLRARLSGAGDMLAESVAVCRENIERVRAAASAAGIPMGINIESVSIRKAEIDAAQGLVAFARGV